jgi:GNAT superfamily N-acetyltransferase
MNPVDVGCRVATAADLPGLTTMEAEARLAIRPARGGAVHLDVDGAGWMLTDRLSAPTALVLCGLIEGVVIGYAVVSAHGPAARIEAIYVEPEARELGVGEELLNAAIAWSTEHGCSTLDAVALPGDRHTKNFFETFGMVARAITVSRRL